MTSRRPRRLGPWRRRSSDSRLTPRGLLWRVVALVVVGIVAFTGFQAVQVVVGLDRADGESRRLQDALTVGDIEGARSALAELTEQTDRARSAVDQPTWSIVTTLPVIGDDADAVRTLARALDQVAVEALPPLVGVAEQISADTFSPQDGRVDVAAVGQVAPVVATTRAVLEEQVATTDAIDTDRLVARLRGPVEATQRRLRAAASTARSADVAVELMPGMLGLDGTRRYLLLIQNNAESRATGGIPGSFALIEARRGRVSMTQQGSIQDLPPRLEPVVRLTEQERSVYPSTLGSDLRDVTLVPDFPRSAQIADRLVADGLGVDLDGVLSVDPVALANILVALGPVELEDGTVLTAENAVAELLNGVYLRYPDEPEQQDAVFEDAARRIFDAFVAGQGEPATAVRALVESVRENRILVWSTREDEQEALEGVGLTGALPSAGGPPHVGVYVSDATASKLQFYLQTESFLTSATCRDETQNLELRTRLTSQVPRPGTQLPPSVAGFGPADERGTQTVNVRIYAPLGGSIDGLTVDGDDRIVVEGQDRDRQVAIVPVTLTPGSSTDLVLRLRTEAGERRDPVLSTTPGVFTSGRDVVVRSACR